MSDGARCHYCRTVPCVCEEPKPPAEQFFEFQREYYIRKEQLGDQILAALDVSAEDPENWPLDDITFDQHDSSFELKDARVGYEPTAEQIARLFALGFDRFWICYVDKTEKYFYK